MKKKGLFKVFGLLCPVAICIALASLPVAAAQTPMEMIAGSGVGRVIFIILCILFLLGIFVVWFILAYKRNSSGYSTKIDWNRELSSRQPSKKSAEDYEIPNKGEIDRMAFMYQAGQKSGEKALEREGKFMVKCPNCGAAVRFAEIMQCDYCKTQIARKSVADQLMHPDPSQRHKVRSLHTPESEEYNPNRYYDDNMTGYDRHDEVTKARQSDDFYHGYYQ